MRTTIRSILVSLFIVGAFGASAAASTAPGASPASPAATAFRARPIPHGDTYWSDDQGIWLIRRHGTKYAAMWSYEGAVCQRGQVLGKRVNVRVYYDVAPSGRRDTATYRTWTSRGKLFTTQGAHVRSLTRVRPSANTRASMRALMKRCLSHL
jgi:hypothetical protein